MADTELQILIRARDEATQTLERINKELDTLGASTETAKPKAESMFGSFVMGGLAMEGVRLAASALKSQFTQLMSATAESERASAQLTAVLRSTGGAAGVTSTEARKLADEMSKLNAVDDEAVLATESMLLTFTNIHKETFPSATQAVIDMATAMNGGLTPSAEELRGSAIQLGKALNDPTVGLTALQRVGVSFSEEQKKVIEKMVETGDVAGAQRLILAELSREFGGSASLAAQTYEGRMKALSVSMDNVRENIGKALMPIMTEWANKAVEVSDKTGEATSSTNSMAVSFYQTGKYAEGLIGEVVVLGKVVAMMGVAMYDTAETAGSAMADMMDGIIGKAKALADNVKGVWQAAHGQFLEAYDSFAKADKEWSKGFDFSKTKDAAAGIGAAFEDGVKGIMASQEKANMAFIAASDVDAIRARISNQTDAAAAAEKAMDKMVTGADHAYGKIGSSASDAAKKQAEATAKAAESFAEDLEGIQRNLKESVEDYARSAGRALDDYQRKIGEVMGKVKAADEEWRAKQAEMDQSDSDRKKTQHEQIVALFVKEKEKLDELLEKNDMSGYREQVLYVQKFRNDYSGIDAEGSALEGKTSIDLLNEKFAVQDAAAAKEREKAASEHQAKMDALQKTLDDETGAYERQRQDLIDSTVRKYEGLRQKTEDGWNAVLKTAKGKLDELRAVESELKAVQANIGSAEAGTGKATAAVTSDKAGQQVVINVMSGATVNAASDADAKALAKTVTEAIARSLQSGAKGLSTQ